MNNFKDLPEYKQSQRAIPLQNELYRKLFNIKNISRFEYQENILDIKYHIDVELELINGVKLLGQEKALSYDKIGFNTFTMEFYQNRFTKEKGEFFNIGAQFYLHGYLNQEQDKLIKWYFILIFDFLQSLKKQSIEQLEKHTRASTSNASFFYIDYNKIPREFIFAYDNMGKKYINNIYKIDILK